MIFKYSINVFARPKDPQKHSVVPFEIEKKTCERKRRFHRDPSCIVQAICRKPGRFVFAVRGAPRSSGNRWGSSQGTVAAGGQARGGSVIEVGVPGAGSGLGPGWGAPSRATAFSWTVRHLLHIHTSHSSDVRSGWTMCRTNREASHPGHYRTANGSCIKPNGSIGEPCSILSDAHVLGPLRFHGTSPAHHPSPAPSHTTFAPAVAKKIQGERCTSSLSTIRRIISVTNIFPSLQRTARTDRVAGAMAGPMTDPRPSK